jgi:hypothetical protein
MNAALWLLALAVAGGLAAWAYVWREEPVPARTIPGVLRGIALFLILAGLWLPPIRDGASEPPSRVVLLDGSRSMSLPVSAEQIASAAPRGGPGAAPGGQPATRFESALAVTMGLTPDRVYVFGETAISVPPDSLASVTPGAERTRLAPALEAARLGGVDSVWVVTDGEWDDRGLALRTAERLGLGVRELRVVDAPGRLGIATLLAPERARAGDTVRIVAEVRAGGPDRVDASETATLDGAISDSVRLELRLDGIPRAAATIVVPSVGRSGRAELAFVPAEPADESDWRRYEVAILGDADPYGVADRAAIWVEVSEASGGAVLVSTDPDWEARFMYPALDRLVLGGVRGFLRLTDGRYLEMGPNPRLIDDVGRIQRSIRGARLLVVQADLGAVPDWLEGALRSHPRKLVLARGPGSFPGTDLAVSGPVPGEWYPVSPVPPSPAAALLADVDLDVLPPLREVYGVDVGARWTILNANRNRRGEARPLLVAHERGSQRWALATAAEWWRWAFRDGPSRRVYEGILSGLVGWLVEDVTPRPVSLGILPSTSEIAWRIRPTVRDLRIDVLDASDDTVWSNEAAEPPEELLGPTLEPGLHRVLVSGRSPDGTFRLERPVEIAPDRSELVPRAIPEPAFLAAVPVERVGSEARSRRPLWPFALAMLLLCGEWVWRHRIGLR